MLYFNIWVKIWCQKTGYFISTFLSLAGVKVTFYVANLHIHFWPWKPSFFLSLSLLSLSLSISLSLPLMCFVMLTEWFAFLLPISWFEKSSFFTNICLFECFDDLEIALEQKTTFCEAHLMPATLVSLKSTFWNLKFPFAIFLLLPLFFVALKSVNLS